MIAYHLGMEPHPLFGVGSLVTIVGSNGLTMQGRFNGFSLSGAAVETAKTFYWFSLGLDGSHLLYGDIKVAPDDWQKILAYAKENELNG